MNTMADQQNKMAGREPREEHEVAVRLHGEEMSVVFPSPTWPAE